jgi:hypothetical protein
VLPQQPLGTLTGGAWRIGYEREPKCPDSPSTNKVGGGYERMPVGLYKALRIETRAPLVLRGSVVGDAELHAEDILDAYLLGGRHITRQWRDTTYRLASDRTQASRARWRSPQMKGAFIRPASVEIAHHVVGQCKMRSWRAGGGRAELDETAVGVVSATVTLVMQCQQASASKATWRVASTPKPHCKNRVAADIAVFKAFAGRLSFALSASTGCSSFTPNRIKVEEYSHATTGSRPLSPVGHDFFRSPMAGSGTGHL